MDMMGSQQYYQIFEDSYGRITNGNNPNVAGIPTTINKGMVGHPPSPLGTQSLPSYGQHPGNYDNLGNFNPMSPVQTNIRQPMGNNGSGDGWGSNYTGSELDFPPSSTATGIPPMTSYNPNNNANTATTRFSPPNENMTGVLNNYNHHGATTPSEFYNLSQPGNSVSGTTQCGVVPANNMDLLPSSIVFGGNNPGTAAYDPSLMLPSTLNEDNRFGPSPGSGAEAATPAHLQHQIQYNANIALKVEPNTSLDVNDSRSNMMLLQSSTNSSTALTCNTINSSSATVPSSAIMPPSELVSTTSGAAAPSATNQTSFFQASPNYLAQSSPAASALSPSSGGGMSGGNMGGFYNSHPPPASSTSPPSSLHSEFGEDNGMGNSMDSMMGSSNSISTSTTMGKRKTTGVSKAATSTTGNTNPYHSYYLE